MTDQPEEPAWLDAIHDDDSYWPTAEEIEAGRTQDAAELDEQAAAAHISDLTRLGHPTTAGDRTATLTIREEVGAWRAEQHAAAGYPDLDDFLNEPEPDYDWLVPGLLEKGDRLILTGQEGKGKSTLLRQIGIQIASGIHPFTLDPITPARVLHLDLENPRRLVRRALHPMRLSAGDRLTRGFFTPVIWSEGLDLRDPADEIRLIELVETIRPDLLITGPSYKLAGGDPTTEEHARQVTSIIDGLRVTHGFALLLEAHQPYAATPGARRAERPYGASLWSRWPEFGLHLADDGQLRPWRGARDERAWPAALQRGGEWPWTVVTDQRGITFARILDETRAARRELSARELSTLLGGHHSTISRAIDVNRDQYDRVLTEIRAGTT